MMLDSRRSSPGDPRIGPLTNNRNNCKITVLIGLTKIFDVQFLADLFPDIGYHKIEYILGRSVHLHSSSIHM